MLPILNMAKTELTNNKEKKVRLLLWCGLFFIVGLSFYCYLFLFRPSVKQDTVFTVKKGSSLKETTLALQQEGLIPDAKLLTLLARLKGDDLKLKAGDFSLRQGQSPAEVLTSLINDRPLLAKVTIPEGFTLAQISGRLLAPAPDMAVLVSLIQESKLPENVKNQFNKNSPISPEGYLFPETYYYSPEKPAEVYLSMFKKTVRTLEELFLTYPQNPVANGRLTLHEAIILASMVEKEALLDVERPLIAGVFLRRLALNMYLQSCATVTYVLEKPRARLTYKDLAIDSPYNTYLYPGLPIGPVGNPGYKSLEAVFNPEVSEYLYFVAKGDGSHVFSKTYKEHLKAQAVYENWLTQNNKE